MLLSMLLCSVTFASAQVSIGIGLPNVSIGINLPLFPELVRVPGYPVYYAPRMDANYFFYDGMYWVYQGDNWYASSWYNGPWGVVQPEVVPLFILRVPVRYYRQPPMYFRGWASNAPPRWGQHWGPGWEQHRGGWDKWKRSSAPAPAPLPAYQRGYSGEKYPRVEQQQKLRSQQYRYQPRDTAVREHLKSQAGQKAPAAAERVKKEEPPVKNPRQQEISHPAPLQRGAPADQHSQPPQRGGEHVQKSAPEHTQPQQRGPGAQEQRQQPAPAQHEQKAPKLKEQKEGPQDRDESQEPNRGQGQGRDKNDDRGRGRDK